MSGTLTGSSKAATNLAGATATTNQIATVGSFTAAGFTLNDGKALTVNGPLNGGPSATITDTGLLSVPGTLSATAIAFKADNIGISGTVTDGGAGTTSLIATTGTIDETGTVIAGTLSGSAKSSANLAGASVTANQIGTVSGFSAAGLTLNDGKALTISGVVDGGASATITDSGLLTVSAPAKVTATAVALKADNIAIAGTVTDGGAGTMSLIATTGTINETGIVIAGKLSGSASGSANLSGSTATANQIATISTFNASGLTVRDGKALTVTGLVNGTGNVTVTDAGLLNVSTGTVTATAIALTADSIAIGGTVSDGGSGTVSLVANTGTINETGKLVAGTLSGSAKGSASLSGSSPTTNQIATLANFTASGLSLNDGRALAVNGFVNGGSTIAIVDNALLTISGTASATGISMTAANIAIPGTVTDGGAGTVNLVATAGTIDEPGTLIVGTLTGQSTGAATLTGGSAVSNQIRTLGNFTAPSLKLNDGKALTVTGQVSAGASATVTDSASLNITGQLSATAIALTASDIGIAGLVTDGGAGTVSLVSTSGTISETGTLIAGTLTGSAAGNVELHLVLAGLGTSQSSNQIANLGSFTVANPAHFWMDDSAALTIVGPLNAKQIVINDPTRTMTFAGGGVIATGGIARPSGTIAADKLPTPVSQDSGAYLYAGSFEQKDDSTVIGNPSILRINASPGGNIVFNPSGSLHAEDTWLILSVQDAAHITGALHVQSLDIVFTGSGGSADLSGSVNGKSGQAAAGAAFIEPTASASFHINACPIHSVNCVLLPTLGLPTANPLNDIYIGSFFNPGDEGDLLLPIVSDQDY